MTLSFPNPSRSYDSARAAVRFWGYENAMEASFVVSEDALRRLHPGVRRDESSFLNAFDTNLGLIHAVAIKVHARERSRGFYHLTAADF